MNETFVKKGNKHFARGQYLEAISFYEKAIAQNSDLKKILAGNISISKKRNSLLKNKEDSIKTLVFISHDASLTGAPAVLLEVVEWVSKNTNFIIKVIIGGAFEDRVSAFSKFGDVLWFKEGSTTSNLNEFLSSGIDLIYANTVVAANLLEKVKFVAPNAKVIAHIHERDGVLNHFEACTQYMIEHVDHFIAVDDEILHSLRNKGLKRDVGASVIAPFIKKNIESFRSKEENDLVTIFGCGTIEDRKGFDLFCETVSKLKNKYNLNFKAAWIGASSNDVEPARSLAKYNVQLDIEMIGKVPNPSLYYRENDIFFMSSREDPFPLVCMEAAQKELALVSFDEAAGSTAKMIRSAECGLVCRYLDTDDAALCLSILLENSDMRRLMAKSAKVYVHGNHTSEIKIPEIYSIIDNTLLSKKAKNKLQSILVISFGPLPLRDDSIVEGGGLRSWGLAKGFTQLDDSSLQISVAYPSWHQGEEGEFDGINVIKWSNINQLRDITSRHSHVVVSYCYGSYSTEIKNCIRSDQTLVLDCYVPIHSEVSARSSDNLISEYNSFSSDRRSWEGVLRAGDYILCASPQQKNYYIGLLYGIGKLHPINYKSSDNIIIAPFGIHNREHVVTSTPISDYFGEKKSVKLLWFGGVYPWFDIKILIDAVRELRKKYNVTLTIVGAKNPFNTHPDFVKVSNEILFLAHDVEYKDFLYVADWVPYEQRFSWFKDASYMVTINKDGIENLFSWRTRLLDYLEFSIPFLTNGGDPLSEELIDVGLGKRIDCIDKISMISSLESLISKDESIFVNHDFLSRIKLKYSWNNICKRIYSALSS